MSTGYTFWKKDALKPGPTTLHHGSVSFLNMASTTELPRLAQEQRATSSTAILRCGNWSDSIGRHGKRAAEIHCIMTSSRIPVRASTRTPHAEDSETTAKRRGYLGRTWIEISLSCVLPGTLSGFGFVRLALMQSPKGSEVLPSPIRDATVMITSYSSVSCDK